MNAEEQAVRCVVAGRVQGVWYRASTAKRAQDLGLRGWAKNLPDGCVEVVVVGTPGNVATLCQWLWDGPPGAQVSGVVVGEWAEAVSSGFETL